ncbi:hypothetical protein DFS34DRAFT_326062 [Phlyctochytrium arcticum]|nr:hypothetical protein DFS34DRAFT_326062 [Phlyctochytrium arcticum]
MFRKPHHLKPQWHLRGSDRRKLCQDLVETYPAVTPARAATLIPSKEAKDGSSGQVVAAKFITHAEDPGTLYSVDGQPVLWRDQGGRVYPTVYALWQIPEMLPPIYTHGPVLRKLCDGADLMLPGVIVPADGLGEFEYGRVTAVFVKGIPMAVGTMVTSSDALRRQGGELRGKGVKIMHVFGDHLWAQGTKADPPTSEDLRMNEVDEESDQSSWTMVDEEDLVGELQGLSVEPAAVPVSASVEEAPSEHEEEDAEPHISPAEMDALFDSALLTALKTKLHGNPKLLPLASSLLFSSYILPCRPLGSTLDIKLSSYKKVGKFLKGAEKKGWIKLKERGGETVLTGVNFSHPGIVGFDPPHKVAGDAKPPPTPSSSNPSAPSTPSSPSNTNPSSSDPSPGFTLLDLHKPIQKLIPLFASIGQGPDLLYIPSDVRAAVDAYASKHNLTLPSNPRHITIDPILADAILVPAEYNTINHLPRDEITTRFLDRMQKYHRLTTPSRPDAVIAPGVLKPISLSVEKRQGRKTVTKVLGVERLGINPDDLASKLRVRCAASTSLTPIPSSKNNIAGMEIMVQGSKIREVCLTLEKDFGVPFGPAPTSSSGGSSGVGNGKGMTIGKSKFVIVK